MNKLAQELNETLKSSVADAFLSERGKAMYFPKGIVAQGAEAGEKAKLYNATVGMATDQGEPFVLTDVWNEFAASSLKKKDIFAYAPGGGDKALRALWKSDMEKKNPTLRGKSTSLPLVTSGLTHTISIVAELFVNPGDEIVCPDLYWDNYQLIFEDAHGAELKLFKPFTEDGSFNVEGMKKALMECKGDTARVILNFPNNPSGYSPSKKEAMAIVDAIKCVAKNKKVMVINDDAYFGLFYEDETEKESLFSYLADASDNIFAIKGDAATKEEMVWGFRVGFITYASKSFNKAQLDALEKKTLGAIRCSVSNCDRPGQSLIRLAFEKDNKRDEDKDRLFRIIKERYETMKKAVDEHKDSKVLKPYPFNSGYFMSFDTLGHDAEELRLYLLDKYQIGVINIMSRTLRVAYCSVENEALEDLVNVIYKAAEELWN